MVVYPQGLEITFEIMISFILTLYCESYLNYKLDKHLLFSRQTRLCEHTNDASPTSPQPLNYPRFNYKKNILVVDSFQHLLAIFQEYPFSHYPHPSHEHTLSIRIVPSRH